MCSWKASHHTQPLRDQEEAMRKVVQDGFDGPIDSGPFLRDLSAAKQSNISAALDGQVKALITYLSQTRAEEVASWRAQDFC